MARDIDTHVVTLVDLPLVTRLSERATVLDNEIGFTREAQGPNGMMLSSILLPQRHLHTLVTRSGKRHVVGQFRMKTETAHIVYITPDIHTTDHDDRLWLHLLDTMAYEAGKHNAHVLMAEIDEDALLFEAMRTCGFAVYARQLIWRRPPLPSAGLDCLWTLREATPADFPAVQSLVAQTVPPFMQQIDLPTGNGWLCRQNEERLMAYVDVTEGKQGIYLTPYIHPEFMSAAPAILDRIIRQIDRHDKLPVYMRVRRYQEWLSSAMEMLHFEPGPRQAVMVKHIAASIRQPAFKAVSQGIAVLAGNGSSSIQRPPYAARDYQES